MWRNVYSKGHEHARCAESRHDRDNVDPVEEEEEEDLFVFNDTIEGPSRGTFFDRTCLSFSFLLFQKSFIKIKRVIKCKSINLRYIYIYIFKESMRHGLGKWGPPRWFLKNHSDFFIFWNASYSTSLSTSTTSCAPSVCKELAIPLGVDTRWSR